MNSSPRPDSVSESASPPSRLLSARPLLVGIAQRLVLLVTVVLVLAVAWGRFGSYLGVPDLFWHQDWWTQLLAGLGAALLLGQVCLVSFLIDAPQPWLRNGPLPNPPPNWWRPATHARRLMRWLVPEAAAEDAYEAWKRMRWYLTVTWLPLILLLALPAFVYPTDDWPWTGDDQDYSPNESFVGRLYSSAGGSWVVGITDSWCLVFPIQQRWPLLAGIALSFLLIRLFVTSFHALYGKVWSKWQHTIGEVVQALPRALWLHLATSVLFVGLLALLWEATTPPQVLLLTSWLAAHGFIVMVYRLARVPSEERWIHWLAGAAFALFFAVYELLFLFYWLTPDSRVTALISPALASCLLLALIVSMHGFLRFHFGGWYTVILIALVGTGTLVNSLIRYQHQFPELAYEADKRVALAGSDILAVLSDADLTDEQKLEMVLPAYRRYCARFKSEAARHGSQVPHERDPQSLDELKERARLIRLRFDQLDERRLEMWQTRLQSKSAKKPKLAVVAVSGGANRSALWTTFVLDKLERELANFPSHVRLISGASGGMVGAAYYTATIPDANGHDPRRDPEAFVTKVAQDSLTPVAQRLLFVDLPATFLPRPTSTDRGRALEEAWDHHQDGALNKSFAELAVGEVEGWRPPLVFAPMLVEDGRRLLISNLYLSTLAEGSGRSLSVEEPPEEPKKKAARPEEPKQKTAAPDEAPAGKLPSKRGRPRAKQIEEAERYRYSLSAVEFFQLFPDRERTFKLSTAVRMSASFPYVSPAVELPTIPRRRVVDAGYYDNYGVNVAASWLYHHRDWLAQHTSGVVLIQIRDSASERRRLYANAEKDTWNLAKGLEWLTGPIVGASNALQSIMSFRNDEQVHVLNDYFNDDRRDFFTTVVFESKVEIALSWHITREEIQHVLSGFDSHPDSSRPGTPQPSENQISLRRLKEWWQQ